MMTKYIAIVEDEKNASALLSSYLDKFASETGYAFSVTSFYDAKSFLSASDDFDIVFMDIELPDGNGMEVVRTMRERGCASLVIFVTNLAQYAVKGYEVRAFDFVVKPIAYHNFALKVKSALDCLEMNKDIDIWITNKDGRIKLSASKITYVEVMKHYVTYHTTDGDYAALGSISAVAKELESASFAFCNRCYLVNLKYVTRIHQMSVSVDGHELQISRQKKVAFLKELNDYLAESGGGSR